MALTNNRSLPECLIETNCFRGEWSFNNVNNDYERLIKIASDLPRLAILEVENNYWHGVVRSKLLRFPDDLEILKITQENKIQIRSASRIGFGDFGVNRARVNYLYNKLIESK